MSIRLLYSNSFDPWFNLSAEEYIFQNMDQNQSILFLWRNQNTVVIGRAQNAWKECNTRRMNRDKIKLSRRHSGGGAVFHDLGNTCFTFMSTQQQYNKKISFNIILNGLNNLGIKGIIFGRNDIVIDTKQGLRKISGSAYRKKIDRQLHHGTLLLHVDINKLNYYLTPDFKKLRTKSITSTRSRVMNLNEIKFDINHHQICQQLQESFFQYYQITATPETISTNNFSHMVGFSEQFSKQCSWDWNFGNAPLFQHQLNNRFNWGSIELHFNIDQGVINDSCIFTDSLDPDPLEELSKKLIGTTYNTKSIQNCCEKWMKNWSQSSELIEVTKWLINNIN